MLGLALTVALAAAPSPAAESPAPAPTTDGAAVAPAPDPTEAPAPAASPAGDAAPAPSPAAEGPAPAAQLPPPRHPRLRGTASLIVGSLAAVSALGVGIMSVVEMDYCERNSCEEGVILLPSISVGLHVLAVATIAPGAALRGRYEARRDLSLGTPRNRRALNIAGIATLGAGGLLLLGGVAVLRAGDPEHASSRGFAMMTAGFSTVEVGAGLLAYARTYDKHAKRGVQARLLPQVTPTHVGLTLTGRF